LNWFKTPKKSFNFGLSEPFKASSGYDLRVWIRSPTSIIEPNATPPIFIALNKVAPAGENAPASFSISFPTLTETLAEAPTQPPRPVAS
jgi:hypothetical protein